MEFRIEEIIQNLVDVANRNDIFVISRRVAKNVVFTEPFANSPSLAEKNTMRILLGFFL